MVDHLREDSKVDGLILQNLLMDGSVSNQLRLDRGLTPLGVSLRQVSGRCAQRERQARQRAADIGHQRKFRVRDIVKEQDRQPIRRLELGEDGCRFEPRADLATHINDLVGTLLPDCVEEAA